jgi:hypothetical protein
MLPEIERPRRKLAKEVVFRTNAAFAKPQMGEALELRVSHYGRAHQVARQELGPSPWNLLHKPRCG